MLKKNDILKKNYVDLLPLFYFTSISLRAILTNKGLFMISPFFSGYYYVFYSLYLPASSRGSKMDVKYV